MQFPLAYSISTLLWRTSYKNGGPKKSLIQWQHTLLEYYPCLFAGSCGGECNHKYVSTKSSVYRLKRNITDILFFTLQSTFGKIKVENSWQNINKTFEVSINHKTFKELNGSNYQLWLLSLTQMDLVLMESMVKVDTEECNWTIHHGLHYKSWRRNQ